MIRLAVMALFIFSIGFTGNVIFAEVALYFIMALWCIVFLMYVIKGFNEMR